MTAAAPAPGQTFGRYTLEELLGQGGFAWVFSARRTDGKSFAIKILKPRYSSDPAFVARFREESDVAASLRHPNIVRIEDIESAPPTVFFAMERYPDNLASRSERGPPLAEEWVVRVATGVAQALAYAHGRGIIHRDIKPHNILLAAGDVPAIADFGLARAIVGYVAASGAWMTIGTPHYLSPEQAQGRPVDGRSDLYSLGITLYQAVTGQLPFRSRDWFDLARMHVEARPEPPRRLRPDLSRRFERIILRCLAKHPDDRYPSAASLVADLDDISAKTRPTAAIRVPDGYLPESGPLRTDPLQPSKPWWKRW